MQLAIAISKKMCYYNIVERQENKKAVATNQKRKVSRLYHNRRNGTKS